MAKTRRPNIHNLHFVVGSQSTYGIRCPGCKHLIALGEYPTWQEGYRIDRHGVVQEMVVCRHREGEEYCQWAGQVRLRKQVDEI